MHTHCCRYYFNICANVDTSFVPTLCTMKYPGGAPAYQVGTGIADQNCYTLGADIATRPGVWDVV